MLEDDVPCLYCGKKGTYQWSIDCHDGIYRRWRKCDGCTNLLTWVKWRVWEAVCNIEEERGTFEI